MAWQQVKVKIGKKSFDGMLEDNHLEIPFMEVGDSINIDGKDVKVVSHHTILSGDMVRLNLADASKQKGEMSDDESVEG